MTDNSRVDLDAAVDPLVLAIDVGTSSTRAIVYDARARMVHGVEVQRQYALDTTADGGVTANPQTLFDLTVECVGGAVGNLSGSGHTIRAIACDTFWHSLMGVGAKGQPLTPVYTWADTRSKSAVPKLRELLDERTVHQRTGAVLHSSYLPAKLLWLRQSDPDLVDRVEYWMSFAEYFYFRLFGERRVSISMASGTGLFDQQTCEWDRDVLDAVGVRPEQLSPIADLGDHMSSLQPPFVDRWPDLKGVPWYLPLGDGACNNVGSGGYRREWPVVMVGTSGAMRVVYEADTLRVPPGLWSYRVDRRRVVQGGALSEGGNVFAWLTHTLQLDPIPRLEEELLRLPPDGHGLTVLPFFAGERSPNWNPNARAAFVGMTLDTKAIDLVQASLEAIAYQFGAIQRSLRQVAPRPEGVIASGVGLISSPALMQMLSDVLDVSVCASAAAEATSRGAALLILEQIGALTHLSDVETPLGANHHPLPHARAVYQRAMKRQQTLYDLLVQRQSEDEELRAAIAGHVIDAAHPGRQGSDAAKHYGSRPGTSS